MELMDFDLVLPSHRWADPVDYTRELGATLYRARTLSLRVADVEDESGRASQANRVPSGDGYEGRA